MIADGYAHEYTYDLPYAYRDAFKAAEASAMANQAGLWSPSTCAGDTQQPSQNATGAPPSEPSTAPIPAPDQPASFDSAQYVGQGNRYNCSAFASQAQAQTVLRADSRDPNRLDGDLDGLACETNRPPFDLVPVPRPGVDIAQNGVSPMAGARSPSTFGTSDASERRTHASYSQAEPVGGMTTADEPSMAGMVDISAASRGLCLVGGKHRRHDAIG
jgi:hypothetical protein